MEGEGMVAIVQGLQDAGLAVTLMGRRSHGRNPTNTTVEKPLTQLAAKSSVKTSTKPLEIMPSVNTSKHRDNRYVSSYQIAHCSARLPSLPENVAEFPPQRTEPCRTQGNFEIGSVNSDQKHSLLQNVPPSPQPIRSNNACIERGIRRDIQPSRCSENFVHSLRQYPNFSLNGSMSSDLLQRLLSYTQTKNLTKSSYHLRSIRSLRNKNLDTPKDTTPKIALSKSIQTYKRARKEKENVATDDRIEKDKEYRSVRDIDGRNPKRKRLRSPTNKTRITRETDNLINASYDYLKSSSPPPFSSRTIDVRYLTNLTRALRDTLQEICDDRPVVCSNLQQRFSDHRRRHHRPEDNMQPVCSNLQQRFSDHRRRHHRPEDNMQPSLDSNNSTAQASSPMVSTGVPDSESSAENILQTSQKTYQNRPKNCFYCREPLPCVCQLKRSFQSKTLPFFKIRERKSESITMEPKSPGIHYKPSDWDEFKTKLEDEVWNWLKGIPDYANDLPEDKAVRKEMTRSLIDKLKTLEGEENFEKAAKTEITGCVNSMPMWCPGSSQNVFKEQIIKNLCNKLCNLTRKTDKIEAEIHNWVNNLRLKTTNDKRDVASNLINRLKPLITNPPADKDLKKLLVNEIAEVLEFPVKKDDDIAKSILKLADILLNQVQNVPNKDETHLESFSSNVDLSQYQKHNTVEKVSSGSGPSLQKNQKLANFITENTDHSEMQEQMQNEINEWLNDYVNIKKDVDSKTKNILINNLVQKLLKPTKKEATEKSRTDYPKSNNEIVEQQIRNWLKDIPELGGEEIVNQKSVKELAHKLVEFSSEGIDDKELEGEISDWLFTMFENKGDQLDERKKINLVSKLVSRLKKVSNAKENNILIYEVLECLADIPNFDANSQENKETLKQLVMQIQHIKNLQPGEEDLKKIINHFLADIVQNSTAKLSNTEKNMLVEKIMNICTSMPKPRKRWAKQNKPEYIIDSLKEEITHALDISGVDIDNRDAIESTLTNILADQVMRDMNVLYTKNRVLETLKDENISQWQSEAIADTLVSKTKEISLMHASKDSTILSRNRKSDLSSMEQEEGLQTAEIEPFDFSHDMEGSISCKKVAQKLAKRVENIILDQKTLHRDKKKQIEDEISKCLENLPNQIDAPIEDQARLDNRRQKISFTASTPNKHLERRISFRPRRETKDFTMSAIDDLSHISYAQSPSEEKLRYSDQLESLIDDWMSNLPIVFNNDDGKDLRGSIIKKLANDIMDRQKYLQLNPGAKTSDKEELEHLKYQVFRWLNQLPQVEDLKSSIYTTENLMERIKKVPVPQLTKTTEEYDRTRKESFAQRSSDNLISLQYKVMKWLEAIPLYNPKDNEYVRKITKDLSTKINQLDKDGMLTETVFDRVVSKWLTKMVKNMDEKYTSSLTDGLKGILLGEKLISFSNCEKRGSQISLDNYAAEIDEWVESLPRSMREFSQKNKKIDNLENNLSTSLYNPKDHLPLQKSDEHPKNEVDQFTSKTKKMTSTNRQDVLWKSQNVSTQSFDTNSGIKTTDFIYENIKKWCESLPILGSTTPNEKEKVKNLKEIILNKVIEIIENVNMKPEIFNDDSLYEDLLNDEIDNLFRNLSLGKQFKNVPSIKKNLIEIIKDIRLNTQNKLACQTYKQKLQYAISKTLSPIKSMSNEVASFAVLKDNLADAYIELQHAANDDIIKKQLKTKISDEINKFCNDYLKHYPETPVDPKKLNRELFAALQKVPVPRNDTLKNYVEQTKIKDQIKDWLKDLPLENGNYSEQMQRNEAVNLLANRLHNILKENSLNPYSDVEENMRQEIKKWSKKHPLQIEDDGLDQMIKPLTERLYNNIETVSPINGTTHFSDEDTRSNVDRPFYSESEKTKPQSSNKRYLDGYAPQYPLSTLSSADRAHLQRIRERNEQKQSFAQPIFPTNIRDAAVSPIPIEAGSQTDIERMQYQRINSRPAQTQPISGTNEKSVQPQPSPYQAMFQPQHTPVSNLPLSPQVVVREYYWNTQDPTMVDPKSLLFKQDILGQTMQRPSFQNQNQFSQLPNDSQPNRSVTGEHYSHTVDSSTSPLEESLQQSVTSPKLSSEITPQQTTMSPHIESELYHEPPDMLQQHLPQRELTVPRSKQSHPRSFPSAPRHLISSGLPPCIGTTKCRSQEQKRSSRPSYCTPPVISSSRFNTEYPEANTSLQPHETRPESLNDESCSKTIGKQYPKPKRSPEDSNLTKTFPDGTSFMGTPCARRRPRRSPQRDEPLLKGKERREVTMRCRCRECISKNCMGRQSPDCNHDDESIKHCSKCYGVHCPHPSFLFFG